MARVLLRNAHDEQSIASPEDVEDAVRRIDDAGWWRIYHAVSLLLRSANRGEPMAYVHEAICRLRDGRRHWNRDKYEDFGRCLLDVVKSLVWNAQDSRKRKPKHVSTEIANVADSGRENAEESLLAREHQARDSALITHLVEHFRDDAIVLRIMECFLKGFKAKRIQEILQLTRKEYETAVRRLRRAAHKAVVLVPGAER